MEQPGAFCVFLFLVCIVAPGHAGTFVIDSSNKTFLLNGKPFRYVSGSMHYFRVHPHYWEDRLLKLKAAGLNAVQTYVPWNLHEPEPGQYDFTGFADLEKFLRLAQKHKLYVLLRAGPYIDAEWEFGGFPAWLLRMKPKVLRTMDPVYIKYVDKWMHKLLPMVKPFLFVNGGPILMVQAENEYGSYYACDGDYMAHLRDLFLSLLGDNVTLFSTDGYEEGDLRCGHVKGVYATVDFGVSNDGAQRLARSQRFHGRKDTLPQHGSSTLMCNPGEYFKYEKMFEPHGPSVNSEYYTGWMDTWGNPHYKQNIANMAECLQELLKYGANVNMYMFLGGTNFGYWSGASSDFTPVPTSYDYDAPLSEAGDTTEKYMTVRRVVSQFLHVPAKVPPNLPKHAYGKVAMKFVSTVQDALKVLCPEGPHLTTYPVPMEYIGHYHGFTLYRTRLPRDYSGSPLDLSGVRDRAYVTLNQVPVGVFSRNGPTTGTLSGKTGDVLDILVENQGRISYGTAINHNLKGLILNATVNDDILTDWIIYPLHLDKVNSASLTVLLQHQERSAPLFQGNLSTPSLYMGSFSVPGTPQDTFLDPRPFSKGQALVNNFSLGRYWPSAGPQIRLYVPAPVLTSGTSQLVLLEVESSPCKTPMDNCSTFLAKEPLLNGPTDDTS